MQSDAHIIPDVDLVRAAGPSLHLLSLIVPDQLVSDRETGSQSITHFLSEPPRLPVIVVFSPVSCTHGLRPPDEAAISVAADSVWVVAQKRIF